MHRITSTREDVLLSVTTATPAPLAHLGRPRTTSPLEPRQIRTPLVTVRSSRTPTLTSHSTGFPALVCMSPIIDGHWSDCFARAPSSTRGVLVSPSGQRASHISPPAVEHDAWPSLSPPSRQVWLDAQATSSRSPSVMRRRGPFYGAEHTSSRSHCHSIGFACSTSKYPPAHATTPTSFSRRARADMSARWSVLTVLEALWRL
ncbi:hypothetical protein OH76DRAFT_213545 [Lentinus brumalis]|uniref:Uncharacterized protein n=1 Tax=Lentinus brumalis TaxID=2498619 RepID=A0A371CMQ6_9APHY|nr:hypothetical protein OH76DRAFT_213545 [Polyporus brumalis]